MATAGMESFVIVRPKASDQSPGPLRPAKKAIEHSPVQPRTIIEAPAPEPPQPAAAPIRLEPPAPALAADEPPPSERSKKKGGFFRGRRKSGEKINDLSV